MELIHHIDPSIAIKNGYGHKTVDSEMLGLAEEFFRSKWDSNVITFPLNKDKTEDGYDINLTVDGEIIELGSYGIRHHKSVLWAYGTGVAEPRFSSALDQLFISEERREKY